MITAPQSAAEADFLKIIQSKLPHLEVVRMPATMQGEMCPSSICDALESCLQQHQQANLDLIVIIRGGGSAEDLSAFNNEMLIRKVATFPLPICTGIGHEIDTSLSDLAADAYESTPTAVAKRLVVPFEKARWQIQQLIAKLGAAMQARLSEQQQQLYDVVLQCGEAYQLKAQEVNERFEVIRQRLEQVNPIKKLGQGYSVTTHATTNRPIKTIDDVAIDDLIQTRVLDGKIMSKIVRCDHERI